MFCALMIVALVGCVGAQISAGCKTALLAVATNPDAAACLSPNTLVPFLAGSQNTSILETVDHWITSMCGAGPCSDTTLSAVVKNVTTGCAGDGSVSSALLENIHSAQYIYPTVRKVLCLKDSGQNCVTQTLTNFQTLLGNGTMFTSLSDSKIGSMIAAVGSFVVNIGSFKPQSNNGTRLVRFGQRSNNRTSENIDYHAATQITNPGVVAITVPVNLTCTNCIKAAAQVVNNDFPGSMDRMFPGLGDLCGVDLSSPNNTQLPVKAASAKSSASGFLSRLSAGTYLGVLSVSAIVTEAAVFLG